MISPGKFKMDQKDQHMQDQHTHNLFNQDGVPSDDFNRKRNAIIASGGILRAPSSSSLLTPGNMTEEAWLAYLEYLERSHIFCSGENQIPGFRRVALFGSIFNGHYDFSKNHVQLMAIQEGGRLFCRRIDSEPSGKIEFMNVLENLESVLAEQNGWKLRKNTRDDPFAFDLNQQELNSNLQKYGFDKVGSLVPQLDKFPDNPEHGLKKDIERILNQIRAIVRDSLDQDLLHNMREIGMIMIFHAEWLTGGDNVSPEIAQARQQAIKSYPIIAKQFYNIKNFYEAIDARESLSDAIASMYQVDQRRVKRLQGLTRQIAVTFPTKYHLEIQKSVKEFCSFPDYMVPDTPEKFRQIEVLRQYSTDLYNKDLTESMSRMSKDCNLWSLISDIEKTDGNNVKDAVRFLAKKLYIPVALNKIKQEAEAEGTIWDDEQNISESKLNTFTDEILSSFSTKELLYWSERYHNNIIRYEDLLEVVSRECSWSGLLDHIDFEDGIVAHEMTSSRELKIQGRTENHCVGGYTSEIIDGKHHSPEEKVLIFSIQDQEKILSTVEIICQMTTESEQSYGNNESPVLKARVGQNMAYSNSEPCTVSWNTAERIAAAVMEAGPDAFATYLDGLDKSREERKASSQIDKRVLECGFNPWNRESLERVWKEFAPGLARSIRRPGLDKFIKNSSISWNSRSRRSGEKNFWEKIDQDQYSLVKRDEPEDLMDDCDMEPV